MATDFPNNVAINKCGDYKGCKIDYTKSEPLAEYVFHFLATGHKSSQDLVTLGPGCNRDVKKGHCTNRMENGLSKFKI